MRWLAIGAVALLAGMASRVGAQDFSPLASYATGLGTAVSQSHAMGDVFRDVYGPGGRHAAGAQGTVKAPPQAVAARTAYHVSPELRRRHVAGFLDRVRKADPRNAPVFEQGFARQDMFGLWQQQLSPFGLSTQDLADVYAAYWIVSWQAAHGQENAQPSREQAQAVRAQSARALTAVPGFAQAGDAMRQELADELILQSLTLEGQVARLRAHPEERAGLVRYARACAHANGIDLDRMRLTDKGFVPA